jgi:hypothetical protein
LLMLNVATFMDGLALVDQMQEGRRRQEEVRRGR